MIDVEHRYARGGLENEKQLAVFAILRKPGLTKAHIKKIKTVSAELLGELQSYLESVQDTFAKQSTSDGFRHKIYDFLYDDRTGLPADTLNMKPGPPLPLNGEKRKRWASICKS